MDIVLTIYYPRWISNYLYIIPGGYYSHIPGGYHNTYILSQVDFTVISQVDIITPIYYPSLSIIPDRYYSHIPSLTYSFITIYILYA